MTSSLLMSLKLILDYFYYLKSFKKFFKWVLNCSVPYTNLGQPVSSSNFIENISLNKILWVPLFCYKKKVLTELMTLEKIQFHQFWFYSQIGGILKALKSFLFSFCECKQRFTTIIQLNNLILWKWRLFSFQFIGCLIIFSSFRSLCFSLLFKRLKRRKNCWLFCTDRKVFCGNFVDAFELKISCDIQDLFAYSWLIYRTSSWYSNEATQKV